MMISRVHIFAAVIFALLSTVLIISWFRYGLLYGGGDVGIPSYDPPRIVDIARYVWWEAEAPGGLVPQGVTSLPMQFFQSALVRVGLPYFAVQATLFWILLFLIGYGMFLVGLSVFGRDKFRLSILCGLFYVLNPYMMIQVWHRFIHNSFFLAAFLPFFYVFWDDWIKRGRFVSILLFLLANVFGVYLYGTIAYIITVVFILSFIFLNRTFIPWQGFGYFKKTAFRFMAGLILWVLIHVWWLLPTFSIAPALFSTQHRTFDSVSTLITLSRQTGIPYSLSGVNPFYVFEQADFGEIYRHPLFLTAMWLPMLLLIPGFIAALRSKILSGWGILTVMAVFLAKGAAIPFGFVYIFAFTQFFALGVLRNPFEKMGIILPFSMAIIYTTGFKWYSNRFKSSRYRFTKIFLIILLFLQLGVFLWPFWTGRLIGKFDKLAQVDVPKVYGQADNFIKHQKKEGKILHLPLPSGESITYQWPYPLSGIESSQLLFSSLPSISRGLNVEHVDDAISAASNIFRENPTDNKIIAVLQNLNVRFIVLHRDIQWEGGFLDNPLKLEKILDSKTFLEKKAVFGDLIVYEINPKYFKPRIYTATQVDLLSQGVKNSFWPYLLSQNNADLISTINAKEQHVNPLQTMVLPTKIWTFHPQNISLEKAITELPAASKTLPGSRFYFLIRLKENFRIFTNLGSERLKVKLNFLGKRLVEAVRLKENNKVSLTSTINSYRKLLSEVVYTDNLKDQFDFIGGREFVRDIFAKHLTILNTLLESGNLSEKEEIQKAKDELFVALRESTLIPMYDVMVDKNINDLEYTTYHFQVPQKGEYELLMLDNGTRDVYQDRLEKFEFQIDGERKVLTGKAVNGFLSYGSIKLDPGKREIILAATPSANLLARSEEQEIEVSSANKFDTEIHPVTADTWYTVKFDAKAKVGDKFKLQFLVDGLTDFEKVYTKDDSTGDWDKIRVGIFLNKPAVTGVVVRFSVDADPATVSLRNIRIERLLNNPIFLRSSNIPTTANPASPVEFTRNSPVYYSGKMKLDREGFIIFSESFHKDWRLKLSSNQGSFTAGDKYLANMYANAWFVPQGGEYNFELEFTPQRKLYQGLIVSISTFLFVGMYYLIKTKKWPR